MVKYSTCFITITENVYKVKLKINITANIKNI